MKDFKKQLTQSVDRRKLEYDLESRNKLTNLIQNLNLHLASSSKENSNFNKKIDKLNFDFYIETEKYLLSKKNQISGCEESQESLFFILFQQIRLYIEEIERLDLLLASTCSLNEKMKGKVDIIGALERERLKQSLFIDACRKQNRDLEKKVADLKESNIKLKRDLDSANRQLRFYKDKLKLDLLMKKRKACQESSVSQARRSLNRSFASNSTSQNKHKVNMSMHIAPQHYSMLKSPEASTNKKSGYYSNSITHQIIKSNENSAAKKRLNVDSAKNSLIYHKGEYSSLFEDEKFLNQNNNSLFMELDIINSTYQSSKQQTIKLGISQNKLMNSRLVSKENSESKKRPIRNLKGLRSKSKDYNYSDLAGQHSNTLAFITEQSKITNISTIPRSQAPASGKGKLHTLKFKLSETNISELIHNLSSNLDEEMKWLEASEKAFLRLILGNDKSRQNEPSSVASSSRTNRSFLMNYQPPKKKVFSFKPKKYI